MPHDPDPAFGRLKTRRQFLKTTGAITAAVAGARLLQLPAFGAARDENVSVVIDSADDLTKETPVGWAAEQLVEALRARGVSVVALDRLDQAPANQECVLITGKRRLAEFTGQIIPDVPETWLLTRLKAGRTFVVAGGSDARGIVYAVLELADRLKFSSDPLATLKAVSPVGEQPVNRIRSVGRLFCSDVEDKAWFDSREFWQRYLTMLATNRFNRINLTFGLAYDFTRDITDCYFHFAYPFLVSVPGYSVRAVPLADSERDANLEMLRFASDEAARRGLQFQLGLWTHAYQWTNSPRANYVIEGLTPETQAPYCRDALRMLLKSCPNITGVTIRTHGESGVAEGNTAIWRTIFDGVATCGRQVEIDLHAKGMEPGIMYTALVTGMPVNISPKFWAEHMGLPYMQGAIRAQEMPPPTVRTGGFFSRSTGSRSFLRYGYGDLLSDDRRHGVLHRIWPGTQRVLLWGDPETAAAYGRVSNFCDSNGVELYEPLSFKGRKGSGLPGGRDAYADASLKPGFDFEKYNYTYRVWGRNLFNPDTDPDGWRRLLRDQFAGTADRAEAALSAAGKILPLVTTAHCPSAANNLYWPEMYWDMQMVTSTRRHPYSDTPSPKRFGTVSPLDPEFFLNCDEFAAELLKGEASGKYSPLWVAGLLDGYAKQTTDALRTLKARKNRKAEFQRLKIDATLQAGLGSFYAARFRAGVFFSLHLQTKDAIALKESIRESRAARAAWARLAKVAKGVYRDDVSYGPDYYQRGHWLDRLAAMDDDITDLERLQREPASGDALKVDWKKIQLGMTEAGRSTLSWKAGGRGRSPSGEQHLPQRTFQAGEAIPIAIRFPDARNFAAIAGVQLRYRSVNQAELWQEVAMEGMAGEFRAMIPGAYTRSPYPVQYYFRIRRVSGETVLRPGLEWRHNGQPYYVVRQA